MVCIDPCTVVVVYKVVGCGVLTTMTTSEVDELFLPATTVVYVEVVTTETFAVVVVYIVLGGGVFTTITTSDVEEPLLPVTKVV